jgi:hypothetical protein
VLKQRWIGVQRERGRLTTVGSGGGGGPVREMSSEKGNAVEKKDGSE